MDEKTFKTQLKALEPLGNFQVHLDHWDCIYVDIYRITINDGGAMRPATGRGPTVYAAMNDLCHNISGKKLMKNLTEALPQVFIPIIIE